MQQTFMLDEGQPYPTVIARGEALRCFIAAIYDTAKSSRYDFTTDDVYLRVRGYSVAALRKATANSKLIAVALRKCEKMGYIRKCDHVDGNRDCQYSKGDGTCHSRPKRIWHRGAHFSN